MPSTTILAICYFFHLIATVVWIGGLMIMTILVIPEARKNIESQPALDALLGRLRKRFMPITHLSLAVLIFTGMIQMSGDSHYDGVLQFDNEWSRVMLYKHIAVFGMIACGLLMQNFVIPALERASLRTAHGKGDPHESARLQRQENILTGINIILGILVLAFTAWATAL